MLSINDAPPPPLLLLLLVLLLVLLANRIPAYWRDADADSIVEMVISDKHRAINSARCHGCSL